MQRFDNIPTRKKVPIKRNNKFFSGEDFDLEMDFAREYMEQDANQTIVLYQVDMQKTKVNDIYNEAQKNAIRFKPPVELTVIYDVTDAEIRSYSEQNKKGLYAKPGKLTFSVLLTELEEKHCDVKKGDYIGIQITPEMRLYWTVTNDGKMSMTSNKNTLYGHSPYYRTCECAPVDETEFNG